MNKEAIKHISTSHYRKIQKHLDKIAREMDGEEIHQLRVGYKKLRAFFRMLSSTPRVKEKIKIPKKLKRLYGLCGSIRDLQLQQERVKEAAKNDIKKVKAYLELLQSEIGKVKPELLELLSEKPVQESRKKTNSGLPGKFMQKDFHRFVENKWTSIYASLASSHFNDGNIHSIRKDLKDLFYNLKTYKEERYKIMPAGVWKGQDEKFISSLLDELGTFQDRLVSIGLLKAYWIKRCPVPTKMFLEELKQQWIKEKAGMKRSLVKKLKTAFLVV